MNVRVLRRKLRSATMTATLAAFLLAGGVGTAVAQQSSSSTGVLTDLQPTIASPTDGAVAEFAMVETSGSTTFSFAVRGLVAPAGTVYGANLHHGVCMAGDVGAAGPRYNATGQAALTAQSPHEVSLGFTVTVIGDGSARTTVPFIVRAGTANSVVISDADGSPVACLPVTITNSVVADEVQGISQTAATDPTELAFTGDETESLAAAGLGLVALGSAALTWRRRLDARQASST